MADITKSRILEKYLRAYGDAIETESIDERSITLSFPFHFASNHRIELTVSSVSANKFIISDSAKTMTELRNSGYKVNDELKEKLLSLAHGVGLKTVREYLVLESSRETLGIDIQKFLEAAKTIGDVYFVHKGRVIVERKLIDEVKRVLQKEQVPYKEKAKVPGQIEDHTFNFFVPPNGQPGMAIAVVAAQNTHNAAAVWYYKCDDIRKQPQNRNIKLGIVYDNESSNWSEDSRRIIANSADIVIPGDAVPLLGREMEKQGLTHPTT